MSNKGLFERRGTRSPSPGGTEPMATIPMRRTLEVNWPRHPSRSLHYENWTALQCTPEGKLKRGRPKITWRRTVKKEGRHQENGMGPTDAEGARCCPTCHLCITGMSECMRVMPWCHCLDGELIKPISRSFRWPLVIKIRNPDLPRGCDFLRFNLMNYEHHQDGKLLSRSNQVQTIWLNSGNALIPG